MAVPPQGAVASKRPGRIGLLVKLTVWGRQAGRLKLGPQQDNFSGCAQQQALGGAGRHLPGGPR